ncbi:DUF3892 domain-containing protein [Neobacillus sp. D3-1R]|uniref:DUF3892 domain-containing protein n=1 Tax=Neobacillus sp. D3-1R TaxID=3445778 RepID=UPI003FA071E4
MEKVVALHRNYFGDIISFQTSEGRIISYRKAIQEVENGLIEGLQIDMTEEGVVSLIPASETAFDDMPEIY